MSRVLQRSFNLFFNVQKWKLIIALQIKHPNDSSIMVVFLYCLTVRCAIGICDEYMPSATLSEIPVTPLRVKSLKYQRNRKMWQKILKWRKISKKLSNKNILLERVYLNTWEVYQKHLPLCLKQLWRHWLRFFKQDYYKFVFKGEKRVVYHSI